MTATFINSFILFFVTIDTIGNLPFFLSLTEDAKTRERNIIALKSTIIAFFILIIFAYVGRYLLEAIGVSLDSLKIAGGIILMVLAIDILFEKRKKRREKRVEEVLENYDEITVFPIAIPFIAGPSAMRFPDKAHHLFGLYSRQFLYRKAPDQCPWRKSRHHARSPHCFHFVVTSLYANAV